MPWESEGGGRVMGKNGRDRREGEKERGREGEREGGREGEKEAEREGQEEVRDKLLMVTI